MACANSVASDYRNPAKQPDFHLQICSRQLHTVRYYLDQAVRKNRDSLHPVDGAPDPFEGLGKPRSFCCKLHEVDSFGKIP